MRCGEYSGTAGSSSLYLIYGFYCYNIAGGNKPTITTTFGTAEGTYYVEAVEVSGVLTTNPLDAQVWYAAATLSARNKCSSDGELGDKHQRRHDRLLLSG